MPKKPAAKSLAPALKSAAKQRPVGKRAALEAAVKSGKLPSPPDFKAKTHERWRPMLTEVVALAKAGGLAQLKGYRIPDYSTSPRAIRRYRDLAVMALSARAAAK